MAGNRDLPESCQRLPAGHRPVATDPSPHFRPPDLPMTTAIPAPLLALLLLAPPLAADVSLPAIFSDHAVLQRDKPLPVWGKAAPGERVAVSLGKSRGTATAGKDGRWQVVLDAQPLSAEPLTLTVAGKNRVTREDILLGDVWLCSGQSNMDWGLGGCDVPDDIAAADHPKIRHFRVAYNFASSPADDVTGNWAVATPGSVPGFSAVGYYFGRKVHAETGVPIGLLTSSVGGTNIELWMSQASLLETPELAPYAAPMKESLARYQEELVAILPAARAWADAGMAASKAGKPVPMPPAWPDYPFSERSMRPRCVTLHHGMIAPLVPMALRGALWYQGESNADDALYLEKKKTMVAEWRRLFRDPALPFYFVQLAAWQPVDDNPAGGGWGAIRDLQRRCLAIPHTGMASAIDIGDAADIHPKNKADVGERLARWALRNEYGKKDLVASGPLFREMKSAGNALVLHFDSTGGGLMAGRKSGRQPAVEEPGAKLRRFAIAGEDRKWVWADAVIEGDTVRVSSPEVAKPVAVRYAYANNPEGANLYNRDGLPASPFRTDAW